MARTLLCLITIILLFLTGGCTLDSQSPSAVSPQKTSPVESKKSIDPGRARAVYEAVEIVLGHKQADKAKRREALETLKENLSVKELRNNRNRRKDKSLFNEIYPKDTEIHLGSDGDQKAFWNEYDRSHFAARHLIEYFDTSDIKGINGWWPAGTTREQLDEYLKITLQTHGSEIRLPREGKTGPGFKYFEFDLPNKSGIRVQVGIQSDGRVTSFFALSGPDVITISSSEVEQLLDAIAK
jgi:hypothetical protein